jgi:hypothetical protein
MFKAKINNRMKDETIIKDEVLLTLGCTIFPMYLFIVKYLGRREKGM